MSVLLIDDDADLLDTLNYLLQLGSASAPLPDGEVEELQDGDASSKLPSSSPISAEPSTPLAHVIGNVGVAGVAEVVKRRVKGRSTARVCPGFIGPSVAGAAEHALQP
jgi:hypothetical protein